MSSKFSSILAQARNRQSDTEDELPASQTDAEIAPSTPTLAAPVQTDPDPWTELLEKEAPAKAKPSPTKTADTAEDKATFQLESTVRKPAEEVALPKQMDGLKDAVNPATVSPRRGRPQGKRSDPNFTQITAYISKSTHQGIKMALLQEGEGREISELIEEQLAGWLHNQKTKI